jgi:hypothetical protein
MRAVGDALRGRGVTRGVTSWHLPIEIPALRPVVRPRPGRCEDTTLAASRPSPHGRYWYGARRGRPQRNRAGGEPRIWIARWVSGTFSSTAMPPKCAPRWSRVTFGPLALKVRRPLRTGLLPGRSRIEETRSQRTSFGTRGSQVQILPLRPRCGPRRRRVLADRES